MATVIDHPQVAGTVLDKRYFPQLTGDTRALKFVAKVLTWALSAVITVSILAMVIGTVGALMNLWRFQPVLSGSMEPAIETGSLTITRPISRDDVRVGDVIVVVPEQDELPRMHRVIELIPNDEGVAVVTQGDNNTVPDSWGALQLPEKVWKQDTSIPVLGRIWITLNTTPVRAALVGIAVAAALWWARKPDEIVLS